MKTPIQDTLVGAISKLLKSNGIRRSVLETGYNIVLSGLEIENFCDSAATFSVRSKNAQETIFLSLLKDLVSGCKNNVNAKSTLRKIKELMDFYYDAQCCFPEQSILIESNHPAIATASRGTAAYASIASGGDTTDFTYSVSNVCAPYSIEVSFNFGGGNVVYSTETEITDENYSNTITNLMDSFLGKQVKISGTPFTIVSNATTPVGNQYKLEKLNGRSPLATVKVTNCLGQETSSTYRVEFEMKRKTKPFAYTRQKDSGACQCAEVAATLTSYRSSGPNYRAAGGAYLGTTVPTASISAQNIFVNQTNGNSQAKIHNQDAYADLGGYSPNIIFRNPTTKVFDALVTQGSVGNQLNCVFSYLATTIDIRDDDVFAIVPAVHFSVNTCPTESPATFNSIFSYSLSPDEYDATVNVGDIVNIGPGTSATVVVSTTPAALGW